MARPPKYKIANEDIEFLREVYPKRDWESIQKHFPNIPRSKIHRWASDNHISSEDYFWSEHDKNILIENYDVLDTKEIQKMLNKEYKIRTIQNQAKKLGLTESREWTKEEIDILCGNYENMTGPEIQKLLPKRSIGMIYMKAAEFGLKSGYVHKYYYTDNELQFIKDNWEEMSDTDIGNILGKDARSIMEQRHKLGLYYDKGYNGYYTLTNYIRMNITDWKKQSMKNCNYKCVLTGENFDDIHHLYSFNLMLKEAIDSTGISDKESLDDYSEEELKNILEIFKDIQSKHPLGVCLSRKVHTLFHKIYGYGDNTEEQWNEFQNNYKNGIYN